MFVNEGTAALHIRIARDRPTSSGALYFLRCEAVSGKTYSPDVV